jgi:hypothetical protein
MGADEHNGSLAVIQANVLDHAREFVEMVHRETPAVYRSLLASRPYERLLNQPNSFNHGKLYVYAEFTVFREEFRARFPAASSAACINAFCGLFLKNDISMTNLVSFMEGSGDEEQLLLNQPVKR